MFPQGLQHRSQMGNVLFSIFEVNQDIVYEYHLKLAKIGSENSKHKIHKSHKGISQAKRHHGEFIVTKSGLKCGFKNVFKCNPRLMVSYSQVNLRKYSYSL